MLCCGEKFLYKKMTVSMIPSEAAIKKVDWNNFIFRLRNYQKNCYFAIVIEIAEQHFTKMKRKERDWGWKD